MRGPQLIKEAVDAQLMRLEQEHVVEIELDDLEDLVREPEQPAFALRHGPRRAGWEDVARTLVAAKVQPEALTVRVVLRDDVAPGRTAEAEAAMRGAARDAAVAAWREAVSIRHMGVRLLPVGIAIAALAALAAYAFGYLGGSLDALPVQVLCFVVAGVAITVAWVVSWMVVEATMLDWRGPARHATAYDLLSRATLEVVSLSS